jgi:pimeloyl-ACP methyl ester carboxylesterase
MNKFVLVVIQKVMGILSTIAPNFAAKYVQNMFFSPRRHSSKPWEIDAIRKAKSITLDCGVHCLVWGHGKPILLVHGWEGRASQMSVFNPYLADKYQLIAIDAPAHGLSGGNKSNPHRFIDAIFSAQAYFGPFHGIIGHSMGGGCSVYAALEQLNVDKVVSIAGPSNFEYVVNAFARFVGLRSNALNTFMADTEEKVGLEFSKLNLAQRIESLQQPILVIHDQDDLEIPFSEGYRYKESIKKGEFYVTHNLGHRKIMQSQQVLQKITDFID